MATYVKDAVKVADELFIVVALLQRENPDRSGFSVKEIAARADKEKITRDLRPGLKQHAYEHAVANRKPEGPGGKYRILYKTREGKLRLLRAGDDVHPERTGKIWPNPDEVPDRYRPLIAWAQKQFDRPNPSPERWLEGIFQMRGIGKELWAGEDADEYIANLRKGW